MKASKSKKEENRQPYLRRAILMLPLALLASSILLPCAAVFGNGGGETHAEGTVSGTAAEISTETGTEISTETGAGAAGIRTAGENEMLADTVPLKTRIRLVAIMVAVAAIAVSVTVSISNHMLARAALCAMAAISAVLIMYLAEVF